jgi:hypothetical protein
MKKESARGELDLPWKKPGCGCTRDVLVLIGILRRNLQ